MEFNVINQKDKQTMKKMNQIIVVIFTCLLMSCGNNKNSEENQNTQSTTVENLAYKIKLFNDPNSLAKSLSQNGIGELKPWENLQEMGWGSLTGYYQFGENKDGIGMQNNLAYYLESEENYVTNVLINLNVNNVKGKKAGVKLFSDITEKTFKTLELEIPKELLKSIQKGVKYNSESDIYKVTFEVEQNNIETYKTIIESK